MVIVSQYSSVTHRTLSFEILHITLNFVISPFLKNELCLFIDNLIQGINKTSMSLFHVYVIYELKQFHYLLVRL